MINWFIRNFMKDKIIENRIQIRDLKKQEEEVNKVIDEQYEYMSKCKNNQFRQIAQGFKDDQERILGMIRVERVMLENKYV